jgi:6-pyruvoyltetrahydropterin/6-carboxytetrahydropterin synthase
MSVHEAFDYANHSEISVEFTFDAGHRIVGHKGKCARLHGHTYRVHVMCAGPVKDPGFVIDFGDIKDLVMEWDHRLLLWEEDPVAGKFANENLLSEHVILLAFNPTAENMARDIALQIQRRFGVDRTLVELWETKNSMARYVT